jgi:Trp operon repressor
MDKKQLLMKLPSIDKYFSRKEWESACWQKLLKSDELLRLLVTSHEQHNLVMRAATLKEIMSGKGPRQISRELFVSLQTVGVIKKSMNETNYKSYSERSKKERKKKAYSVSRRQIKSKWRGRPRRTKFGTIYVKY